MDMADLLIVMKSRMIYILQLESHFQKKNSLIKKITPIAVYF